MQIENYSLEFLKAQLAIPFFNKNIFVRLHIFEAVTISPSFYARGSKNNPSLSKGPLVNSPLFQRPPNNLSLLKRLPSSAPLLKRRPGSPPLFQSPPSNHPLFQRGARGDLKTSYASTQTLNPPLSPFIKGGSKNNPSLSKRPSSSCPHLKGSLSSHLLFKSPPSSLPLFQRGVRGDLKHPRDK